MVRDKETGEAEKELGNKAFRSKDYAQALVHYNNAIMADPKKGEYYSNRSATRLYLGDELSAIDDANMCIKYKPKWWKGYLRLALAYLNNDRLAEMEDTCRLGLEVCQDENDKEGRRELQDLLMRCMIALSQRKMKEESTKSSSIRDSRLREFDSQLVEEWKKYSPLQVVENSKALLNTIKTNMREASIKEECRILNNVYGENDLFSKIREKYHPTKFILDCLAMYQSISDENLTELLKLFGNSVYACRNTAESVRNITIPSKILDSALLESKSLEMRQYALFAVFSIERNLDLISSLPNYKFGPFFNMFASIIMGDDVQMKEFAVRNLCYLVSPLVNKDIQYVNAIATKLELITPFLVKMVEGYASKVETRECSSAFYCVEILTYFAFHHPNLYRHGTIRAAVLYMDPTISNSALKQYALAIISYSTINKTGAYRLQMQKDTDYQSKVLPLLKNYRNENINILQGSMECLLRAYCYKSFHQYLTKEYCKEVTELIAEIIFYLNSSTPEYSTQDASFLVYCSSVVEYLNTFDGVSYKLLLKKTPTGISLYFNVLKGIMKYYKQGILSIARFIEAIIAANSELLNDQDSVKKIQNHMDWCKKNSTPYFDFSKHIATCGQLLLGYSMERDLCIFPLREDDYIVRNGHDIIPDSNCQNCRKKGSKICSRCGNVRYCSAECQKDDWPIHKHVCNK